MVIDNLENITNKIIPFGDTMSIINRNNDSYVINNLVKPVAKPAGTLFSIATLLVNLACSGGKTDPPVERVENIQNFRATSSADNSVVIGTHQYSINGASGALGSPVSAGFTNQNVTVNSNITITGDGVIPRVYQAVPIYGTQTRTDKLSGNGRYDPQNWVNEMLGVNETYKHPSIELRFYDYKGWVIPSNIRNGIKAEFDEFVRGNPYVKTVTVTDGGVFPGSYSAEDGVIKIWPSDETSSISNSLGSNLKEGSLQINPNFGIAYSSIPGECKDLAGGPKNQRGAALQWNTIKMGSVAYAEGRNNFEVKLLNNVPTEYQSGFSGNTSQSSTVYSTLQSAPGQTSLFGGDDGTPDNEKMVVGRRYGETPRMEDIIRRQEERERQNKFNFNLSYKSQVREKK